MPLESPPQIFFYVNIKRFKSNTTRSEKYSENTEASKKEIYNCHSVRRLYGLKKQPPGSVVLQNGCSERLEKVSRKTSVVEYSF